MSVPPSIEQKCLLLECNKPGWVSTWFLVLGIRKEEMLRPLCTDHWIILPMVTQLRWLKTRAEGQPTESQHSNILRQLRRELNQRQKWLLAAEEVRILKRKFDEAAAKENP